MNNSVIYTAAAVVVSTWLVGCGGGDGGSSSSASSLSLSQKRFEIESGAFGNTTVDVPFKVNYEQGNNLYYGVMSDSGNLLANYEVRADESGRGTVTLNLKPGYELGAGARSSVVRFAICHDYECTSHYSGSPADVSITNNVVLGQQLSLATPMIEVTANYSDPYVEKNIPDAVSLSGEDLDRLNFDISETGSAVSWASLDSYGDKVGLNLQFETPSSLGEGLFQSSLRLKACYDINCQYPVEGSPLTIPVHLTVGAPISGGDGTGGEQGGGETSPTPPTNIDQVVFESSSPIHNIVDAVYSDELDVIAVISDSPKSAIYFYSLSDKKTYQFDLAKKPSTVAVDNINRTNRFVVGHDAMITTLQYDPSSPVDTTASNIFNFRDVFDLTTDGKYVWSLPKEDQWVELEIINLETGAITEGRSWGYRERTLLKINPTGKNFYSLTTNVSPIDISNTDISQPETPSSAKDSRYHGDYDFCRNLWFDHSGAYIYTECGVRLNASEDESLDMTYAGRVTLPSTGPWGQTAKIQSLDGSHDGSDIAYALIDNNSITIIDSVYMNQKERFVLPDTTIDGGSYQTVPKFLFYSATGKLNIIAEVTVGDVARTVVLQK